MVSKYETVHCRILNILTIVWRVSRSRRLNENTENFCRISTKGNYQWTHFMSTIMDHRFKLSNSAINIFLLVIDAFRKFVKLFATKPAKTLEVLLILDNYFRNDGVVPNRIATKRGTWFTSGQFSNLITGKKSSHILVATACPKAQMVKLIERIVFLSLFEPNWPIRPGSIGILSWKKLSLLLTTALLSIDKYKTILNFTWHWSKRTVIWYIETFLRL